MLTITIPACELWDRAAQEFITIKKDTTLRLEHSLVSVSKWKQRWCKPFLTDDEKTMEEFIDYIQCMTITQNVDPIVYRGISNKTLNEIKKYIKAPMTATTFHSLSNSKPSSEFTTSELIYYWMLSFNIPVEFEKWHLNRLITLIRVCSEKNQPQKKKSEAEILKEYARINEMNRKKYGIRG